VSRTGPRSPDGKPGPTGDSVRRLSLRGALAMVTAVCLLGVSLVAWSYVRALTVPGGGSLGVRSVDWLRQEGFSQEVAGLENLWYTYQTVPKGGHPSTGLTARQIDPRTFDPSPSPGAWTPPPSVTPVASPPLPGEGQWQPIGGLVGGRPALYAAFLRPDPVHTSLTAALVWINPRLAAFHLVAGSVDPGGAGWPCMAPLATALRRRLLATFNPGFRLKDSQGGYYQEGRSARPLIPGAASLVIMQDGTATVGQWGRDVTMTSTVAAVRQNLSLIVDGGQITPGVYQNSSRSWGFTVRNEVLVWRSGIGVTASGALIYAAGPGLSIASLATLLLRAGVVRAMELDINTPRVAFASFKVPAGGSANATNGSMLLPEMTGGVARYLGPSTRDFFALVARKGAAVVSSRAGASPLNRSGVAARWVSQPGTGATLVGHGC
jgi:hypothetical protein